MNHQDKIVNEILSKPENNPSLAINMCTALLMNSSTEDRQTMTHYANQKDWYQLGLKIYAISFERQLRMAESEAAEYFNQLNRGNYE